MFKKVLIANRGAIAVRIIRTLAKLNVQSVVIYAESDRESLHVKLGSESYCLGDGGATETYLNQEKIINIAKQSGAEAIHPGYGFLSENARFTQLCEQSNIVFLGPTAKQIEIFGLKHKAREIAKSNGVPLVPGSSLIDSLEEACSFANKIGFPVMLKATAGGGGIGMSRCDTEHELRQAFESVQRLGKNNFSNSGVFVEKFIGRARHVEVQVFGDGQGNAVALGDRDCSSQRRNQKVIEEAPAPNIPEKIRHQMASVAERLLSSVNYRNAGTVEYIYDAHEESFYFLEVNTRLQVEHGVTEEVYKVDLVEWMVKLGAQCLDPIDDIRQTLNPQSHSIQIRIYAEDPNKNFQPSSGLLSYIHFPTSKHLRIDHWLQPGIQVSPFFDPMLGKLICTAESRDQAISILRDALKDVAIYGIETNIEYAKTILEQPEFLSASMTTRFLDTLRFSPYSIDILQGGTQTTIQDYPGRKKYWHVGIPPSGPFDSVSFQLGNQLLQNDPTAAGMEITLSGPTIKFNQSTQIVLTGAVTQTELTDTQGNEKPIVFWQIIQIKAGDVLKMGKVLEAGARAYLLISGGFQCPKYLDSRSTFTLGQFGGHNGRAIRTGDVLHFNSASSNTVSLNNAPIEKTRIPEANRPPLTHTWKLRVVYGPHGAPDFFTKQDIKIFFSSNWEVHYNSSRTGVRLIGPKPEWARSDGGEAGMHPSNIHDNAYAIGAVDFTGDMPVILGPDGPSLGGFVCPATVIVADLWKLGQVKAGDHIQFVPVSIDEAVKVEQQHITAIGNLKFEECNSLQSTTFPANIEKSIVHELPEKTSKFGTTLPRVIYRPQGDHNLLVEYGELTLDINLRFRVHALMLWLENNPLSGIEDLTPGVRSLQIHYNSQTLRLECLLNHLEQAEKFLDEEPDPEVDSRIVHLPLSWDDEACRLAIEKYMQSVRKEAPWCPSNIEFIRRINGLQSIDDVKKIVFDANYLVLGLGDVYLGAPLATPIDPRHRLVTTKYNPARTWTAENSVGIGGSYLCVYGMEGPGGYQFIGRTLQMWNKFHQTREFDQPWLLRFFDQIKFYEVSADELKQIRRDFPLGNYPLKIEKTTFNLNQYNKFIEENKQQIDTFTNRRENAFDVELQNWISTGQIHFTQPESDSAITSGNPIPDGCTGVESHIAGNVWKINSQTNDRVSEGDVLLIIESMKMEIEITAPKSGKIKDIIVKEGDQVQASSLLAIMN